MFGFACWLLDWSRLLLAGSSWWLLLAGWWLLAGL
jgi:hypothetical protein